MSKLLRYKLTVELLMDPLDTEAQTELKSVITGLEETFGAIVTVDVMAARLPKGNA